MNFLKYAQVGMIPQHPKIVQQDLEDTYKAGGVGAEGAYIQPPNQMGMLLEKRGWMRFPDCLLPATHEHHKDPIIVLGIPRSGTSMTAGILASLGVLMGLRFQVPDKHNPRGDFEDRDFVELHTAHSEKLISDATMIHTAQYFIAFRRSLGTFNPDTEEEQDGLRYGWKDPRTIIYLRFYLTLCPNAKIILLKRDLEGLKSSVKRKYKAEDNWVDMFIHNWNSWVKHVLCKSDLMYLELNFEDLRNAPAKAVKNLCDYCELTPPNELYQAAVSHVIPNLKT